MLTTFLSSRTMRPHCNSPLITTSIRRDADARRPDCGARSLSAPSRPYMHLASVHLPRRALNQHFGRRAASQPNASRPPCFLLFSKPDASPSFDHKLHSSCRAIPLVADWSGRAETDGHRLASGSSQVVLCGRVGPRRLMEESDSCTSLGIALGRLNHNCLRLTFLHPFSSLHHSFLTIVPRCPFPSHSLLKPHSFVRATRAKKATLSCSFSRRLCTTYCRLSTDSFPCNHCSSCNIY